MGVWPRCSKTQKSLKLRGVGLVFKVCGGVVVIVRKGCKCFRGSKSVICDLESVYQWYMIGSKGFECFIWLRKNVKSMILSKNNGVLSKKVGILSFCW